MRKILVTGPESSGKSTLARQLAWYLDGIYCPEYAREYLNARNGTYAENDLAEIWTEQARRRKEAERSYPDALLIHDTGPYIMKVWREVRFGSKDAALELSIKAHSNYDLCLLCAPDLPWEDDPLREAPDYEERLRLFGLYRDLLVKTGKQFAVIQGERRIEKAISIIPFPAARKKNAYFP